MIERQFTVTVYILDGNKTLLLNHPKHQKWLPPGGHVEPGETPPECGKREVLEETGLEIEYIKQENIWINAWNARSFERPYLCLLENIPPHGIQGAHQHLDLIYVAKQVGGSLLKEPVEKNLLRWWTLEEMDQHLSEEELFGETKETIEHLFIKSSNF
ncbi:MAG TPA: NUDIX domain-containing protein [Rhabdochlamydiaceae bacterium]|nr:NUDIX domain-containing protein [Rhabdochlamydiaceae bacterium]